LHRKPDNLKRLAIIDTLLKLFDREVDAYWLAREFFQRFSKLFECHSKFRDLLKTKMEMEDATLYKHLLSMNAFESLPLDLWFGQCFAGFITETSLVR